jgi:hypothetical protein
MVAHVDRMLGRGAVADAHGGQRQRLLTVPMPSIQDSRALAGDGGSGVAREWRRRAADNGVMNFRHMPELDWPFGYPPALGILLLTIFVLRWNLWRVGWL